MALATSHITCWLLDWQGRWTPAKTRVRQRMESGGSRFGAGECAAVAAAPFLFTGFGYLLGFFVIRSRRCDGMSAHAMAHQGGSAWSKQSTTDTMRMCADLRSADCLVTATTPSPQEWVALMDELTEDKLDYLNRVESAFKRVSALVTARDIVTPFAMWAAESDTELDILNALRESGRMGSPVGIEHEAECLPGVYLSDSAFFELDIVTAGQTSMAGEMESVTNEQLISGDTTLFELIELFAKREDDLYLLVDRNQISGVVRFVDLLKPPARICLFGLTLEVEFEAMRLCSRFAEQCFVSLPEKRRKKAVANWLRRFKAKDQKKYILAAGRSGAECGGYQMLLDCTMLIDKATMITKCKLTGESHKRIRSVFKRVENLRNTCAHPALVDDTSPQTPKELWTLVHDCHDLIDTFRRLRSESYDSV